MQKSKVLYFFCLTTFTASFGQKLILNPKLIDFENANVADVFFTVYLDSIPEMDTLVNFTSTAVTFSDCQSLVFDTSNWQKPQKVYIGRQSSFSSLNVAFSTAEILAELVNLDTSQVISNGTITLTNLKVNRGATCSSTGDPHFVTFNGQTYDYQSYHTVWLMQSPFLSVQCLQMPCNNYVTCNIACTIEVSDGQNSAQFIASAHGSTGRLAVSQTAGNGTFLAQHLRHEIYNANSWKFFLQDSASISLAGRTWPTATQGYLDIVIFVPTSYNGLTAGLCGAFDNNANALLLPNGTYLGYRSKGLSVANTTQFANAWTIRNSSVPYNQIYNVINGTNVQTMSLATMYKFQPYSFDTLKIIKLWSSLSFKQCTRPLKVLPTLVKPPTGLIGSTPFNITWDAIRRYTQWGRYTPLITDPDRYYPGYKFKNEFAKRSLEFDPLNQNETKPEGLNPEGQTPKNETKPEGQNSEGQTLKNETKPEELEVNPDAVKFIKEQCQNALYSKSCNDIVPNTDTALACELDIRLIWNQREMDPGAVEKTLTNYKNAYMDLCKHSTNNLLSLIPMQLAIKIDNALETVSSNVTKLERRSSPQVSLESIAFDGLDSVFKLALQSVQENGFMHFTPDCRNNGQPNMAGGCDCPPGNTGILCEHKIPEFTPSKPTPSETTPSEQTPSEPTPSESTPSATPSEPVNKDASGGRGVSVSGSIKNAMCTLQCTFLTALLVSILVL